MSNSISNQSYQQVYRTIKIQILRVEINHSLKIKEFSPYIIVRIGNEQKKTLTNFHRDPYNAIFNEIFEFKEISKRNHLSISLFHKNNFLFSDKYLGQANISLDNPLLTNFRKLTLLNDQEKTEKLIGYLYIKIFVENENEKKILKEEYSSNYINQDQNKNYFYNEEKEKDFTKNINLHENQFINNMNLKEIKTIFKELRLERRKIQTQEKKMKKFYMVIKQKEKEFNDEKLQIQQKKDLLTEEENLLVNEKEKCLERIKEISKEKLIYLEKQNDIKQKIELMKAINIKHKLRGTILSSKLSSKTKFLNEMNERIVLSKEILTNQTEKQSYVSMSYLEPDVEDKISKTNNITNKKNTKSYSCDVFQIIKHVNNEENKKQSLIQTVKEKKKIVMFLKNELDNLLNKEKKLFDNYQKYLHVSYGDSINSKKYNTSSNFSGVNFINHTQEQKKNKKPEENYSLYEHYSQPFSLEKELKEYNNSMSSKNDDLFKDQLKKTNQNDSISNQLFNDYFFKYK